jgi:hypothetical protein
VPQTIVLERWDNVAAPSISSDWSIDINSVGGNFVTSTNTKRSSPNALKYVAGDGSLQDSLRWLNQDGNNGDAQASALFYFSGLSGAQCTWKIACRWTVKGTYGTYYAAAIEPKTSANGGISLWKMTAGVQSQLGATVGAGAINPNIWYLVQLVCRGTSLSVFVQRQTDYQWLSSGGTWSGTRTAAITSIVTLAIGDNQGWAGIIAYQSAGEINGQFADDFVFESLVDTPLFQTKHRKPAWRRRRRQVMPPRRSARFTFRPLNQNFQFWQSITGGPCGAIPPPTIDQLAEKATFSLQGDGPITYLGSISQSSLVISWQSENLNLLQWPGGRWATILEVTTGNAAYTLTGFTVFRVNACGIVATVGTAAFSQTMNAGSYPVSLTGAMQTSSPLDSFYVELDFFHAIGSGPISFNFHNIIETPLAWNNSLFAAVPQIRGRLIKARSARKTYRRRRKTLDLRTLSTPTFSVFDLSLFKLWKKPRKGFKPRKPRVQTKINALTQNPPGIGTTWDPSQYPKKKNKSRPRRFIRKKPVRLETFIPLPPPFAYAVTKPWKKRRRGFQAQKPRKKTRQTPLIPAPSTTPGGPLNVAMMARKRKKQRPTFRRRKIFRQQVLLVGGLIPAPPFPYATRLTQKSRSRRLRLTAWLRRKRTLRGDAAIFPFPPSVYPEPFLRKRRVRKVSPRAFRRRRLKDWSFWELAPFASFDPSMARRRRRIPSRPRSARRRRPAAALILAPVPMIPWGTSLFRKRKRLFTRPMARRRRKPVNAAFSPPQILDYSLFRRKKRPWRIAARRLRRRNVYSAFYPFQVLDYSLFQRQKRRQAKPYARKKATRAWYRLLPPLPGYPEPFFTIKTVSRRRRVQRPAPRRRRRSFIVPAPFVDVSLFRVLRLKRRRQAPRGFLRRRRGTTPFLPNFFLFAFGLVRTKRRRVVKAPFRRKKPIALQWFAAGLFVTPIWRVKKRRVPRGTFRRRKLSYTAILLPLGGPMDFSMLRKRKVRKGFQARKAKRQYRAFGALFLFPVFTINALFRKKRRRQPPFRKRKQQLAWTPFIRFMGPFGPGVGWIAYHRSVGWTAEMRGLDFKAESRKIGF